jgi:hypothetical protein
MQQEVSMKFRCPVCLFPDMPYPPEDYHICPCCGTEFGNDDALYSHEQLRGAWADADAPWFFGDPPPLWNPWKQLEDAGQFDEIPWLSKVKVQSSVFNIAVQHLLTGDSPSVSAQTA